MLNYFKLQIITTKCIAQREYFFDFTLLNTFVNFLDGRFQPLFDCKQNKILILLFFDLFFFDLVYGGVSHTVNFGLKLAKTYQVR